MKTARPPSNWLNLHAGDAIHTKVPRHRIDKYMEQMGDAGYRFELGESKSGYWLRCTASPHNQSKRPKLRLVKS